MGGDVTPPGSMVFGSDKIGVSPKSVRRGRKSLSMRIFVCRIVSDSQRKGVVARTGLRSPCMISIACRYSNPLAALASLRCFRV